MAAVYEYGVLLRKMTDSERISIKKRLRDRYVKKYGYDRKIIIDDIIADFVDARSHEPDTFAFKKLDMYIKKRLTGIMSNDMTKFSYHLNVKAKKAEEDRKAADAKRKLVFSRDCMCDKDPEVVRGKNRPRSVRHKSPERSVSVPQNHMPDYCHDGMRPAGYNRKAHYERKHYGGGVLYPHAFEPEKNYFRVLLDEQIKIKQENSKKHAVDIDAERFKLRLAQQKLVDERFDEKKRQLAFAKTELDKFMMQAKFYKPDANEEQKWKLQDEMLLGFENMCPIIQPIDSVRGRHSLVSLNSNQAAKAVPKLYTKAPRSAQITRKSGRI
jgi:hypothetical protein